MKSIISLLALILCFSISGCKSDSNSTEAEEEQAEAPSGYYQEKHRLQLHFSPEKNWMNDPNGMVYYDGEYHLFYQYYPDSTIWGPMHWGHAVSRDLITWEHLPIALYPDTLGYIFSGSAVVDWNNTSGFGENGKPPLIAIFTYHDPIGKKAKTNTFQYQGIAYSNDKGRTWTKYDANPVVPNPGIRDFRDPKVIWDEGSQQWIMVFAAWDHVKIYGSPNLKTWTHLSDFGREWGTHAGVWECPDLFPMSVEGTEEKKWVLLQSINPGGPNGGSGTQYFVGDFDGKKFELDNDFAVSLGGPGAEKAIWIDYGRDNYAGVTWSDIPKEDGRRIFLGWMSNWGYAQVVPTEVWRSAMTLPRALKLKKTEEGLRLYQVMVEELTSINGSTYIIDEKAFTGEKELKKALKVKGSLFRLQIKVLLPEHEKVDVGLALSNDNGEVYRVGFDGKTQQFYSDRIKAGKTGFSKAFASAVHWAPRKSRERELHMEFVFDRGSSEFLADNGALAMTDLFFPNEDFNKLILYCFEGAVNLEGRLVELAPIW